MDEMPATTLRSVAVVCGWTIGCSLVDCFGTLLLEQWLRLLRTRDAFEWSRCTAQPESRTTGMRLVFVGVLVVVVGSSCMWYVVLLWWLVGSGGVDW